MLKYFFLLIVFFCALQLRAQYFQFSQYNYTEQRISPAAPANSDYATASLISRSQSAGDRRLSTNMLSLSYPLIHKTNGRRWSGIGFTAMDDRSGGIYKVDEATLSYAANVFLSENQTLSLGVKGMFQQRGIDMDGLYTGLQYFPDRGFDESASNGENLGSFRTRVMTASAGLSWQQFDDDGIRVAYTNVSLFDFNKPHDISYVQSHHLSSTVVAGGGFRAYKSGNLSLFPEALYTRSASNNVLNAGLITRCNVKATAYQKAFYVDLISKCVLGRSAIFGLQFHNENFSFGFSYDWPILKGNPGNFGAFEVGIEIRSLVSASLKNKKAKAKTPVKKTSTVATNRNPAVKKPVTNKTTSDSLKQKATPKKNLTTKLQDKKDSVMANAKVGEIQHEPFVLDKITLHFGFKFNSSELDESSTQYLDDLVTALKEDEHLNINLAGHTDNIGSAKFNQKLSLHRANAIKDYLVSKGIDASRISAEGKGMDDPLNDNKTEEDRAKNRRVELTILYKE